MCGFALAVLKAIHIKILQSPNRAGGKKWLQKGLHALDLNLNVVGGLGNFQFHWDTKHKYWMSWTAPAFEALLLQAVFAKS